MSEAIVEKRRGISPIWILPILAICLGGWLLFKSHRDAGIVITLRMPDSSGITAEKTPVVYKGNTVGIVKAIHGTEDLQGVILTIEMNKNAEPYLVEDLKFWVETVEVEVGRITGLDTLLSGNYIGVQLGTSTKPARSFVALTRRPPVPENAPGLHLTLHAEKLNSLAIGSGIYHKDILIGSVQEYALQEDGSVLINIYIQPEYQQCVKEGSRFWNASGITISGGISDFKVHVASLASIVKGGIMMQTPAALEDTLPAENGQSYILYENFEKAEYGIPMTLDLPTGEGIKKDSTRVMYRGLEVGVIKELKINKDAEHSVTAHVLLDPRAEVILREGTVFYMVKPEFSLKGIRNLDTVVSGTYITFVPGEGDFRDHFQIRPENPPQEKKKADPGDLEINLAIKELSSVNIGSPILYKKFAVGEITNFTFREQENDILLTGLVWKKYAGLLKTTSRFYNLSGVQVSGGLTGVKIRTGSLESIVDGGVAFFTPEKGEIAGNGQTFTVFDDFEAAEKNQSQDGNKTDPGDLRILLSAKDLTSINIGSPILYKKVAIGKITKFILREKEDDVLLTGLVWKKYAGLLKTTSRFYNLSGVEVSATLSGVKIQAGSLVTIVEGGVAFFTPVKGEKARDGQVYRIFNDFDAAENSDRLNITIHFGRSDGLKKGVKVKYHGIEVGEVSSVFYENNMETITVEAKLEKDTAVLLKDATRFWLVRPEFSLGGTQHLDTLVGGPYIAIAPGKGAPRVEFDALAAAPAIIEEQAGLNIVLEADNLSSLKSGDHVYYRKVVVGKITGYALSPSFRNVLVNVLIYEPFVPVIRENTKFWNSSGIRVSGGVLSGFTVSTESLEGLLSGGISLATPEKDKMGGTVADGHHFHLYSEVEDAWLKWIPEIVPDGRAVSRNPEEDAL